MELSGSYKRRRPIWSASPTPFLDNFSLDETSVARAIEQHIALGCDGIFLGGTCGEGPWMKHEQIHQLVECSLAANGGQLEVAVQVTENSVPRVLAQIDALSSLDIEYVVVAQPAQFMNATPSRIARYYLDILERSPLPVCFYNRGSRPDFPLDESVLREVYSHPRLAMVKDSSPEEKHMLATLAAKKDRESLAILAGNEFRCHDYLSAGYDGLMLGGAVITGGLLRQMADLFDAGEIEEAAAVDHHQQRILKTVYGGEKVACWLTGLKYCLVRLGIFDTTVSHLEYPLTDQCQEEIVKLVMEERNCLTGALRDERAAA